MQIGPYQVLEEVARGGAGVVYRAAPPAGEVVAIKLLLAGQAANPAQRQRFLTEVQALARLDHPHVMPILDVGECPQGPYLVMPFVPGESLEDRLRRSGRLPLREAVELAQAVALGLQHVHGLSLLHRDVKPANVILAETGEILLSDFGLAKDLDATQAGLTRAGTFMGTPGYWSPEQAAGQLDRLGPATDVYGLGATLYAALTGSPPFGGESTLDALDSHLHEPAKPPSLLRPGLPPALDRVCLRCLQINPGDRYPNAAALARDLAAYLAAPRTTKAPAARRRRAHGPLAIAGAILLLGLGLAGWVVLGSPPSGAPMLGQSPEDEARARVEAGLALLRDHDNAGALAEAERALERVPGWARAYVLRAFCRVRSKQLDLAKEDLRRALRQDPEEPLALYLRGMLAFLDGRNEEGLVDVERAIELEPERPGNYVGRATIRQRMGDLEAALVDANHAIGLDDDLGLAWERRASIRLELGDSGGLEDLNLALERQTTLSGLVKRGQEYMKRGQFAESLADYDAAIELDPERAGPHDSRGLCLSSLGRHAEALPAHTEAIRLDPTKATYYGNRSVVHRKLEDLPAALADLDHAQELDPRHPAFWIWRGELLEILDRPAEALAAFDRLVEVAPSQFRTWLYRGQFLRKRGQTAEARRALERALALDPDHRLAGKVRAMLAALEE